MAIRFAAVGLEHDHIYDQVKVLQAAGAEFAAYYGDPGMKTETFAQRHPDTRAARSIDEILEDESIHVIACAARPDERAPIGVRAMRHGKDFLSDKPTCTTREQLDEARRVQAETGRIFNVYFSERLESRATVKAGELARAGAIGRVVQTVGFGPHRLGDHAKRPPWTFDTRYYGGILTDIASHQIDQFLFFTGCETAEIASAYAANLAYPQYPAFEDVGDISLRADGATGYIRVDWLTPAGLATWGDVRLFLTGTDGFIELRKNIDLAGRDGKDHLFLTDAQGTQYIDCSDVERPFAAQFLRDVQDRTETAIGQAHTFTVCELAIRAQEMAKGL